MNEESPAFRRGSVNAPAAVWALGLPIVWGPAVEGERTMSGGTVPGGWVWTCTCGRSGVGLLSEVAAAGTVADADPAGAP